MFDCRRSKRIVRSMTSGLVGLLVVSSVLWQVAGCGNAPSKNTVGDGVVNNNSTISPPKSKKVAPPHTTTIRFTDVTNKCGVDAKYHNGSQQEFASIVESVGGGVAMVDYDLDGALDLFFPRGGGFQVKEKRLFGLPSVLYRNLGQWRFAEVSHSAGDGFAADRYTHGAFAADFDNDGFRDVLITAFGGLQLWQNQGDGTFLEIADAAELDDRSWSTGAGWGDVNGDGLLDLYVAHYVNWTFDNQPLCLAPQPGVKELCSPKMFDGLPDTLYLNQGDGTFRDATKESRLRNDGKGLGVVLGDLDLDGDLDIYVANDTTDNFFYVNDGKGKFKETAALSGLAVDNRGSPNGSMGVDIGDYNLDGLPDLWVANYEVEAFALYRNDGQRQFLHVSEPTGVTGLGGLFVGFGTMFVDLDRDGDEDLLITNGHVLRHPRASPVEQLPLVLINHEGRRYKRLHMPNDSYFSTPHAGRGLAAGDLDNDGDMDFVFTNNNQPAAVLRNDSTDQGQWVQMEFIGSSRSNRDAIGAVLRLETSTGVQLRMVKGGSTYLSQNDLRCLWGVPPETAISRLTIRWPSGNEQQIQTPPMGKSQVIIEPE